MIMNKDKVQAWRFEVIAWGNSAEEAWDNYLLYGDQPPTGQHLPELDVHLDDNSEGDSKARNDG